MRAIVHSGGGSKGGYGASAIGYLLGDLGLQHSSLHGVQRYCSNRNNSASCANFVQRYSRVN